MSGQRRNFSAKFKSDLVIGAIKGEKTINELAAENNIQPNLLRNRKNEFHRNASVVFDEKRDEKAAYAKKVGQLTMQVDRLKKNLRKYADLTTRTDLVRSLKVSPKCDTPCRGVL